MKKIILSTLISSTALLATYSSNAYIYKDPRIMSMGGANVAAGGFSSSVFSNPAGLRGIPRSHGLEVELLNAGVSASTSFAEFAQDLQDATSDSNGTSNDSQVAAVGDVLNSYSGEHFHLDLSNYTSISRNNNSSAFSIGLLQSADFNFIPHGNGGTESLLEYYGRAYGGVILGFAKSFNALGGKLDIGIGTKYIYQQSFEGGVSISELIENDTFFTDHSNEAEYFGIDFGAIYSFWQDGALKPKIGMSILNVGFFNPGLSGAEDIVDNYGKQVMTLNAGASISPTIPYLGTIVLAADYMDLTNTQEIRSYNFSNNEVTTSAENADLMKKLRLGASWRFIDNPIAMVTLNGGMYQGEYTAGLDAQLLFIKASLATYAEQIAPASGDFVDRRVMANIGFGW